MTKRSNNASYAEGKEWIYVSVTETLSETDYDKYMHGINICTWIKRALFEELGIQSDKYDESSFEIYDMFFENNFYQDGLTASVRLNEDIVFEDIKNKTGKDTRLEIADIFLLNLNEKSIKQFINENKMNMREQTIFSLKSYLSRRNFNTEWT